MRAKLNHWPSATCERQPLRDFEQMGALDRAILICVAQESLRGERSPATSGA
jgi:hypothetical protein